MQTSPGPAKSGIIDQLPQLLRLVFGGEDAHVNLRSQGGQMLVHAAGDESQPDQDFSHTGNGLLPKQSPDTLAICHAPLAY